MANKVTYGMNTEGPYAVMGMVDGFSAAIKTDSFVSAILKYSWAKLSEGFDLWMDMEEGPSNVDNYMHVYRWPSEWGDGDKPDYASVMRSGDPANRLWSHVYSGPAKSGTASFVFKDDDSFSPVNPILAEHGVHEGVHIFVHKATVMEYGLPVTIKPQLARYLAYVVNSPKGGGTDESVSGNGLGDHFVKETEGGKAMFSEGPVKIHSAGNNHTKNKFTSAFKAWYKAQAPNYMATTILPGIREKLMAEMEATGKATIGRSTRTKNLNMTAWASQNQQAYGKAKIEARQALAKVQNNYIDQARIRRESQYE